MPSIETQRRIDNAIFTFRITYSTINQFSNAGGVEFETIENLTLHRLNTQFHDSCNI